MVPLEVPMMPQSMAVLCMTMSEFPRKQVVGEVTLSMAQVDLAVVILS